MTDQHKLPPESMKPTAYDAEEAPEPKTEVSSPSVIPSSPNPATKVPLHAEGPEQFSPRSDLIGEAASQPPTDDAQADKQESDHSRADAQTRPPDLSPEEVEAQVQAANESVLVQ